MQLVFLLLLRAPSCLATGKSTECCLLLRTIWEVCMYLLTMIIHLWTIPSTYCVYLTTRRFESHDSYILCLVMAHTHRVFLRSDDPGGPTQRHVLVHQNTPTPHKQHQRIFSLQLQITQEETEGSKHWSSEQNRLL